MNGRNALWLMIAGILLLAPVSADGANRYVALKAQFNLPTLPPYDNLFMPAQNIQDALDYAEPGDTVLVAGVPRADVARGRIYNETITIPRGVVVLGGWDVVSAIDGSFTGVDQRIFAIDSLMTVVTPVPDTRAVAFAVDSTAVYDTTDEGGTLVIDTSYVYEGPDSNTVFRGFMVQESNVQVEGSGVFIRFGSPRIEYNVFVDNRTSTRGGAIFIGSGSPSIRHNTVAQSLSSGPSAGAVHVAGGSPLIQDNIFYLTAQGYAVACTDSSIAPVLSHNVFYDNADGDALNCAVADTNYFGLNPVFCDDVSDDYRLFQETFIRGLASDGGFPGAWEVGCRARTKYVNTTGEEYFPYDTPNRAARALSTVLQYASAGDTILVSGGRFSDNFVIPSGILLSCGWNESFTQQSPTGQGTYVTPADPASPIARFSPGEEETRVEYMILTGISGGEGAVILADSADVVLEHLSVVGNRPSDSGGALIYAGDGSNLRFWYSMFALNEDAPVFDCGGSGAITLETCNLWSNDVDVAPGCTPTLNDTSSVEPFFCDPEEGDFQLYSEGGLDDIVAGLPIGALGQGCNYSAHYIDWNAGEGVFPYATPEDASSNLEAVLEIAATPDTVRFTSGLYETNMVVNEGLYLEGGWTDSTFTERLPSESPTILRGVAPGEPTVTFRGVFSQFANPSGLNGFVVTHQEGVYGPGVAIIEGSRPRLRGNVIAGNRVDFAATPGYPAAGVVLKGTGTSEQVVATIRNNTIVENVIENAASTDTAASGLFMQFAGYSGTDLSVVNDNIIGYNSGARAGMVIKQLRRTVQNNIAFGNTDAEGGNANIVVLEGPDITSQNLLVDPLLCDIANEDYELSTCSPAVVSATGDTVIGALPISRTCICDNELFLVNPLSGSPRYPYSSRRTAANKISILTPYLSAGDTVKVSAGSIVDEFELVNGVTYMGGYNITTFVDTDRRRVTRIGGGGTHRVITAGSGIDSTTLVDKFQIASGRADSGGAVLVFGDAAPTFRNNQFLESRADGAGAALFSRDTSRPHLYNNIFYKNSAPSSGGVLQLAGAGGVVANNTFSDNKGGAWALWIDNGAPEVYNNAFTYNDRGVRIIGETGVAFDHNNVFRHTEDYGIDIDTTGQANISDGPLYCARGLSVYTVFDHSPMIAAGRDGGNIGAMPVGCSTPVHYVNPGGSNEYPYTSRETGAWDVQDALDVASLAGFSNPRDSTDEVRIVQGTYEGPIVMPSNVRVYGGYSGFGTRDYVEYPTIIDGLGEGSVVTVDSGAGGVGRSTTIFDGFILTGGHAEKGGGVLIGRDAKPTIRNNIVRNCSADVGGGFYISQGALPRIERNVVEKDSADAGSGLFMEGVDGVSSSAAFLTQNTFVKNHTRVDTAGVVHLSYANPSMTNSVVAYSSGGAGLFHEGTLTPNVRNNLFYGNAGGDSLPVSTTGVHLIAEPGFCDTASGSYGILYDSDRILTGESPIRDQCAVTVWGAQGVGCTRPGHRFLVYYDDTGNNNPVFPYVCAGNASRDLATVLDRVNPGDTVDVGGDRPETSPPTRGAFYRGNFVLDRPIVLRGGFDAGFTLPTPRPDSIDLQAAIEPLGNGPLLTISQDPQSAVDSTLRIDSTTVISGFIFAQGSAELLNGGAIRCIGGASPTIRDCAFIENSTKNWGGAISIRDAASPRIVNNYFYRNSAGVGGGIYLYNVSDPLIRKNIFQENSASTYGGVRLEQVAGGSVDNNVFFQNAAGAISLSSPTGELAIRNNNIVRNGGVGISLFPFFTGANKPVLSYNNVWANMNANYSNLAAGDGSISSPPLFCNTKTRFNSTTATLNADFFRYQECSSMLEAGSDPSSDLDAHIGVAGLSDVVCADTTAPGLTIGFLLHSTIPMAANLYVVPTEDLARDSVLLRVLYADAEDSLIFIPPDDTLTITVYRFDSTEVDLYEIDPDLSVYMTRNIELRAADTLIVEARAVDRCGKVGFQRRNFRSRDFVRGKTGWLGTLDKRARLEIPGDAIGHDGIALSEEIPWSRDTGTKAPLLGPYRFDLSQIRPVAAMDLTVSVAGMGLDREALSKLAVYQWDGERWEHLESRFDPDGEAVSASVYSGGVYTVLFSESVTSEEVVPRSFALYPNSPNPFNPVTKIAFDLPAREEVSLKVFDVRGRQIRVLEQSVLAAGRYDYAWDGQDGHGRPVGSGVYFYRLVAGENTATRKMTLIR